MRLRETDSLHFAAQVLRRALSPPDPTRAPSPVRVYRPDGTLRAVVDPVTWAARFPVRLTPRRLAPRRRSPHPMPASETPDG